MRHSLIRFLLLLLVACLLSACSVSGPQPINYGTDLCDYCDMTIADKAFGSELVTKKGKVLKYDSIECLVAADLDKGTDFHDVHSRWVTDFYDPGTFLSTDAAIIVATDRQKSPMGVGLVAVNSQTQAADLITAKGGRVVNWEETKTIVAETWKLEIPR